MKSHPLKVERELRGWSQARVAEALAVSTRTVARWEQGLAIPYPYYREQLCLLFGKTVMELELLPQKDAEDTQKTEATPVSSLSPGQTHFLFDPMIPFNLGKAKSLLGRNTLLQQVKGHLFGGETFAPTALQGLPGVGKTTLAAALVMDQQVQAHFSDGILWAGLGPRPNRLGLLARWGTLLGIAPTDIEDATKWEAWKQALQSAIGSRRFFLVIDDAWSLEDAQAFQVGGKQCAHVLTTRLRPVASAFAQEGAIAVPELDSTDGLALLALFAPQVVQQEHMQAQELVRTVSGLPLALMLMGKYLASQFYNSQPRRLHTALAQLHQTEQRLRLSTPTTLSERSSNLPENTPLSLQAAIAVSDHHLSQQAHAALCSLIVFPAKPNSFSEEAALSVCQQTVDVLSELWNTGLLERSGPGRYTLHQAIADYAHSQNTDTAAQERLANYILSYILAHEHDYQALERENSNILAALDAAVALGMHSILIQSTIALTAFLRVRGLYSQIDSYLQQALQGATILEDQEASMELLRHLATFAELRGDYSLAEAYAQQALVIARQAKRLDVVSALFGSLGNVAMDRGEYVQAQALYEEGLALAQQLGASEQICALLKYLGAMMMWQGNARQAERLCLEGLTLARQNGLQELVISFLATLGGIAGMQSNFVQAEEYCLEGLTLARQLGHREHQGDALNILGGIASYQGKYEQAEEYFQEALALARQVGRRAQISFFLTHLGVLATLLGDYKRAECYLEEGIELVHQLDTRHQLPFLLMNLGHTVGLQGDYSRANTYLQESVELARAQGATWDIGAALNYWGEVHLKYQHLEEAAAAFHEVVALNSGAERDPQLVEYAHYGLAKILALLGNIAEARQMGQECLATFETLKHFKAREVRTWLASLPH